MTSVSLACKYMICQIKKTPRVLCCGLLCFGFIGGCGERISEHGHTITQVELDTIKIGKSKRADVLGRLGQPSFEGAFDSQKLYYVSQIMEAPVAGINTTKARTIYSFTFDKGTNDTYNYICEPHELLEMVGTITVNPYDESNSTDTNSTSSVGSEQDDMSSSSSLSGFLFIPALALIILVSRRLR